MAKSSKTTKAKAVGARKSANTAKATTKIAAKSGAGKRAVAKRPAKAVAKALGTSKIWSVDPAVHSLIPLGAPDASVLDRLFATVTTRRDADPQLSHSARLLSRGTAKVAQKFGEEAVECLIEAVAGNREALIGESADVLYHLIVMWVDAGLAPHDVWAELARREGVSGIAEKASRGTRSTEPAAN